VFGAQLKVVYDDEHQGQVIKLSNTFLAIPFGFDTVPRYSQDDARLAVAAYKTGDEEALLTSSTKQLDEAMLFIYKAGLHFGRGDGELSLVWSLFDKTDRVTYFVDAHKNKVLDAFEAPSVLERTVQFENQTFSWTEGDTTPTAFSFIDNLLAWTKDTYDVFYNLAGWDSFNGQGPFSAILSPRPSHTQLFRCECQVLE